MHNEANNDNTVLRLRLKYSNKVIIGHINNPLKNKFELHNEIAPDKVDLTACFHHVTYVTFQSESILYSCRISRNFLLKTAEISEV